MSADLASKRRRHSVSETTAAPSPPRQSDNLDLPHLRSRFAYWRNIYEAQFDQNELPEHNAIFREIISEVESRGSGFNIPAETYQEHVARLGNPQNAYAAIHVTGTNGKGSVCAKIADQLASYCMQPIGLFTSPHIRTIRERFRIGDEMIDGPDLLALIRVVEEAVGQKLRFFQLCCLVGFLWFQMREVRVAVIEVGIGGALDPTNVIESPICCVVTSVGLDHIDVLGNTIGAIARNKAGIIKAGASVVVGPNLPEDASREIRERTDEVDGARLHFVDCDFSEECTVNTVNGLIAREACRAFMARMQPHTRLWEMPLSPVVPPGRQQWLTPNVLIDGGHNAAAMRALAQYAARQSSSIYVGIALSKRRGLEIFDPLVRTLGTRIKRLRYIHFAHEYKRPYAALKKELAAATPLVSALLREDAAEWPARAEDLDDACTQRAVRRLLSESEGALCLFCGTFYVVGAVVDAVVTFQRPFFEARTFC